jgi:hypothetical protein
MPDHVDQTLEDRLAQDEARLDRDEARLDVDEARLTRDEQRLLADEARLEVEEAKVDQSRLVAWSGVGVGVVLAIAIVALVLSMIAVQDDLGVFRQAVPPGSVNTAAIRDQSVTADKLGPGAVGAGAVADGAIGRAELAPDAVSGPQVARNSLTGADIRERSLDTVPAAKDAARLGGVPAYRYLSRIFDVSASSVTDRQPIKGPVLARCPVGSRVISGGAAIAGAARGAALVSNAPAGTTGWTATARVARRDAPVWRLVVTAVCATGGD